MGIFVRAVELGRKLKVFQNVKMNGFADVPLSGKFTGISNLLAADG